MQLGSNALTSLEAVKSYLKIDPSNTVDDDSLIDLINACSCAIENYCDRKFKEQTFTEEEYDGSGTTYILLQNYPIKSVSQVTVDGEPITSEQFKVKKSNGTLIRVNSTWPKGDINVIVTYVAGFTEIPSDLELACRHFVMSFFKADLASFSTTFQEGLVFRPEALPSQVKALVQPYKKVV